MLVEKNCQMNFRGITNISWSAACEVRSRA
uniref:Uncharacterized protein n=1 Tax=Anguilla anguilla TaxID=7936 RepID=A0A0E9Q1X0_ANGAN